MASDYRVDGSNRLVWTRGWGSVSDQEMLAHARQLRSDPRFEPDFRQLIDATAIAQVLVTPSGVRALVAASPFGAGARRAVVAGSDEVYGMWRMYQMLEDAVHGELEVFRRMEDALEWLRLPSTWTPPPPSPGDWVFDSSAE